MRVRRAHDHRVRHSAQCDVVGKAASARSAAENLPCAAPAARYPFRLPSPASVSPPKLAADGPPLLCLPAHHVVATWTGNWAWIKHMDEDIERISIADFEADCLRLLDQIVRQRR